MCPKIVGGIAPSVRRSCFAMLRAAVFRRARDFHGAHVCGRLRTLDSGSSHFSVTPLFQLRGGDIFVITETINLFECPKWTVRLSPVLVCIWSFGSSGGR